MRPNAPDPAVPGGWRIVRLALGPRTTKSPAAGRAPRFVRARVWRGSAYESGLILAWREDGVEPGAVLLARFPAARLDVAADLLGLGRAGDDGGDRGLCEQPSDRHVDRLDAAVLGEVGELVEPVPGLVVGDLIPAVQARAGRRLLAAPVLARQEAAGQREEGQHGHAAALAFGQHVALDAALQQRVLVL